MSEGTKIGEFKDDQEFNTSIKTQKDDQDLTATKFGQYSPFEQSLIEEESAKKVSEACSIQSEESEPSEESESEVIKSTEAVESTKSAESKEIDACTVSDAAATSTGEDNFAAQIEMSVLDLHEGDTVDGVVRSREKSGLLIDIGYKSDGFLPNAEIQESKIKDIQPGEEILVFIDKLESKEGYCVLSRKKAVFEEAWKEIIQAVKDRTVINVKIDSVVQGGLVVSYRGIRGFIPASQVIKEEGKELDDFVSTELTVAVLQADRKRRKVIYSHKLSKNKKDTKAIDTLLEGIEIGDIRTGKVTSIKDFGIFVDIGGIEGLVHISELSWSRVSHPSDFVNIGDDVRVFILGVDKENRKISMGMKQLEADPWVEVASNYEIDQVVEGEISRVVSFGAFIKIEKNLEGLIHISELSNNHIDNVENVVKVGETVKAKIIKLIPEEQKIGLSIKALNQTGSRDDVDAPSDSDSGAPESNETVPAA